MLLKSRNLCLAVLMCICIRHVDSQTNKDEPRILILGAGMSGITAAKTLADAGYHNIQIIEGSPRIGGRMKSVRMSGYTVEHGAMWVYGAGTNPIYKLLSENSFSLKEDYPDTLTVLDTSGSDVTREANVAQVRFDEAMDMTDANGKDAVEEGLPDFTASSRLRFHNWIPKTEVDDVIEAYNIDFEFGVPPQYLSGKHAYWWAPFEEVDSEDMPILNDPRGFESLVQILRMKFKQNGSIDDQIIFNEIVQNINQTNDGIDVYTISGSHYHGDYVIVTFGLGVLQNREVAFYPKLPDCKQMAIDKFGMSAITHIYLMFPLTFWDDTMYTLFATEDRGKYSILVNLNYLNPGSNILQLTVWGDESRRIERLEDQEIMDEILRHLGRMYPNDIIPYPDNFTLSRWTYDPLYHGAYSYWPTGFTENNMADMIAPYGRMFFAGEHLDPVQYSYVHGAYASGIKTATDLVRCFQEPSLCPPSIDDNFKCSRRESTDDEDGCVSRAGPITVADSLLTCVLLALYTVTVSRLI